MDDETLGAKLQELTSSDPSLGYRAVHAELKKDPKFASIGLKKVQLALQSLRADQSQTCGSTPAKSGTSGVCLSEREFVSEPPSDAAVIGGFTKSEIEQRLSSGNYSEIVQERLKLVDIPGKGKGYVAAKQIKQGEVCISSVPPRSNYQDRQEKLSGKGFRCRCERCVEESIVDPQLLVPCKCGKFKFSIAGDVPRQQSCSACQCQFERSAAMANLRSLEAANEFMRTHSAAQADPRELVKKLNPVAELATVGRVNGAPPNHLQSLQLLNNLANCHYFVATRIPGPHRKTSLGAFFDIKERFMTAYEANHGKTMQRDTNYVQSLHRVLMGDFSDKDKKKMWERKLVETCVWHFGQRSIPVGVTTDVHS
mmetsp:Transcript_137410/g.438510  ORF Transcript_137410/g.438510 Transcript_137410/m.438510 type:complete len:368 (+) Transcript_137410:66-1169(+)